MSTAEFPIIGIGASAGGIDAFHSFFDHMPADFGMAFVMILHLPAARKSMLTEILARWTTMPVIEVVGRVEIKPNQVYVPPPHAIVCVGLERKLILRSKFANPSASAYLVAEAYAWCGEKDQAFQWLEQAYQLHDSGLSTIKWDPLVVSLRGDQRYAALLRKMNFLKPTTARKDEVPPRLFRMAAVRKVVTCGRLAGRDRLLRLSSATLQTTSIGRPGNRPQRRCIGRFL
jgi:hypothetical protein